MGGAARPRRKSKANERALLAELATRYGYRFFEMQRKSERYEAMINLTTGHYTGTVRMIRIACTEGSTLFDLWDAKHTKDGKRG